MFFVSQMHLLGVVTAFLLLSSVSFFFPFESALTLTCILFYFATGDNIDSQWNSQPTQSDQQHRTEIRNQPGLVHNPG